MAYRPPVVPPRRSRSREARAALEAQQRRAALVQALKARLAVLFEMRAQPVPLPPGVVPRGPGPVADIPPRGPFRGEPVLPPEGVVPQGPGDQPDFLPGGERKPVATPVTPDWVPSWPPPSAADWRRMPGFYDEQRDDSRFF